MLYLENCAGFFKMIAGWARPARTEDGLLAPLYQDLLCSVELAAMACRWRTPGAPCSQPSKNRSAAPGSICSSSPMLTDWQSEAQSRNRTLNSWLAK
jgi:hypothetical protein